jgi:hypothetical protein
MNLRECRVRFTVLFATKLIPKAIELGYEPAFDETMNHQGKGHMPNSLHYSGCAGDLILYDFEGHYLPWTESYKELGEYWKSLDKNCKWGGDFTKPDGNHFSFAPVEIFGGRQ